MDLSLFHFDNKFCLKSMLYFGFILWFIFEVVSETAEYVIKGVSMQAGCIIIGCIFIVRVCCLKFCLVVIINNYGIL